MEHQKLMDRARDELFSHINRCGVLQAEQNDQSHWMDETIDYIGERYPDLTENDLRDLHGVGMRFCQPAITYGQMAANPVGSESATAVATEEAVATEVTEETIHEVPTAVDAPVVEQEDDEAAPVA